MKYCLFALIASSLLLASCQSSHPQRLRNDSIEVLDHSKNEVDTAECQRQGGVARQVGMLGLLTCVLPLPDAGKVCRSSADCSGACFAPLRAELDSQTTGTCQRDTASMFGCNNFVEDGVVVRGVCVD